MTITEKEAKMVYNELDILSKTPNAIKQVNGNALAGLLFKKFGGDSSYNIGEARRIAAEIFGGNDKMVSPRKDINELIQYVSQFISTIPKELVNLNDRWKKMISEKFSETSWTDLEKRWKGQKDAILNDPFFDKVKNYSEKEKQDMLQSIVKMYFDGDINTKDTMSYAVNSIKNDGNYVFICYEYLYKFMGLMDSKSIQPQADKTKLNQTLPGLFDKDGKLNEKELNIVKEKIEYFEAMATLIYTENEDKLKRMKKWKEENKEEIEGNREYINQILIEK